MKKCKPYDTSCHLKVIQTWHNEFESSIESLISYLQELSKSSKQARVECSKNYSKIVELTQAKTRFTLEVSHELKSPLSAVYNMLNVVLGGYLKDDTQKQIELLTRARSRIKEINFLLDDLLILSRLEEGTIRLKKEPVDIKTKLISVIKEMEKYAEKKEIRNFSWQVADNLPSIFGNLELLVRVFENIIDNAIKYTDSGGMIEVKAYSPDKSPMGSGQAGFLFQVMDTGIGIKEEEIPKVFDIFFRGSCARPKNRREGMGLGLSLVNRIIDAHKGTISIKSKLGQGTTVMIQIPEYQKGGDNGKTNSHSR